MNKEDTLDIYNTLSEKYKDLNWWPVDKRYHEKNKTDPRFEIITGAILTQNTAWSNVEKALNNLKEKNQLDIKSIKKLDIIELREMIRPSGFFKQKATRLKTTSIYLAEKYNSDLDNFFKKDLKNLRAELLSLNGIGPETADSILLYAGSKPVFVVDAYTKRLCERLPIDTDLDYDSIQKYFQETLSKKYTGLKLVQVYNQFHAYIVILAKDFCRKKPVCKNCPLNKNCKFF
jgi:endonuclease III related protein